MAGTAKQFNRDEVLANALSVFWAKGYAATSMQDLVDAMSINRASMYDTFGNKRALFELAFNHYCQNSITAISTQLEKPGSHLDNLKKVTFFMIANQNNQQNHGCFANNVAIELGPHEEAIAQIVREFWQDIEKLFDQRFQLAVQCDELPETMASRDLAYLLNTFIQGAVAKSKVGIAHPQMKRSVDAFFNLLTTKSAD